MAVPSTYKEDKVSWIIEQIMLYPVQYTCIFVMSATCAAVITFAVMEGKRLERVMIARRVDQAIAWSSAYREWITDDSGSVVGELLSIGIAVVVLIVLGTMLWQFVPELRAMLLIVR